LKGGPVIYKYPLPVHVDAISMPKSAIVLCVQVQNGEPYIWALVDPSESVVLRRFLTLGTGIPVHEEVAARYIGTYQLALFGGCSLDMCSSLCREEAHG